MTPKFCCFPPDVESQFGDVNQPRMEAHCSPSSSASPTWSWLWLLAAQPGGGEFFAPSKWWRFPVIENASFQCRWYIGFTDLTISWVSSMSVCRIKLRDICWDMWKDAWMMTRDINIVTWIHGPRSWMGKPRWNELDKLMRKSKERMWWNSHELSVSLQEQSRDFLKSWGIRCNMM